MKAYWNEAMTPRPGLRIQEVKTVHDNVYIKDQHNRVWQVVIQLEHPEIRLLGEEE